MFRVHVHFHAIQTHFHMKVFARTRFEKEAQGNSEMAHCPELFRTDPGLYCNANEKS